jgi:dGTPase
LKYPWFYGENPNKMKKWGAYSTERETFHWVRKDFSFGTQIKSLEAEIMDWADDITYAVHDVIDFFCAGKIPLERLSSEDDDDGENERAFFLKWVFEHLKIKPEDQEELSKAFQEIIEIFPLEKKYMGTTEERWRLWQLITNLISRYVDAIHVVKPPHNGDPLVWFEPNAKAEVTMLKQLTWCYVIKNENRELETQQSGQIKMINRVFETLYERANDPSRLEIFPPRFEVQIRAAQGNLPLVTRLVCDYVSGMTEKEITTADSKYRK